VAVVANTGQSSSNITTSTTRLLTKALYFDKVYSMFTDKTTVWSSDTARQLVEALVAINTMTAMQNFLRDAMTEKEIIEISSRLEAARLLIDGKKYTEIVAQTKLSSRTVARISIWLKDGCNGYATALQAIHHDHIPPVRAE
jgi:TrpR-related protein YerC/YecD